MRKIVERLVVVVVRKLTPSINIADASRRSIVVVLVYGWVIIADEAGGDK